MVTDAQLNKCVLEGCVLKLLEGDFLFSAEIVERMRRCGFSDFSEGTLYPMLLRLEKDGCFIVARKPSPNGPPKKYYNLFDVARQKLESFLAPWQSCLQRVVTAFFRKLYVPSCLTRSDTTLSLFPQKSERCCTA